MKYQGVTSTEEAIAAVKRNGNALQYVRNQTEEVCLEAVKQNGNALQYVRDPELFKKIQLNIS